MRLFICHRITQIEALQTEDPGITAKGIHFRLNISMATTYRMMGIMRSTAHRRRMREGMKNFQVA